jgi:hypothetical protein
MVLVNCPGCKQPYKSGRSLSSHQRACGAALKKTAKVRFRKRGENVKEKLSVKMARESDMVEDSFFEARNDLRERANSFEPETGTDGGGKRKLSNLQVCRFRWW